MEIPLNTPVECTDGICGRSEFVLVNPVMKKITHLVVKENSAPNTEYIVPIGSVVKTVADTIQLRCTLAEFKKMNPFMKTEFVEESSPSDNMEGYGSYGMDVLYYFPYSESDTTVYTPEEVQQIPLGEFAIHRGTEIEAVDGVVGKVDEFVVDAKTSRITHLVMREGHLWGKKEVILPVSSISKTSGSRVHLNLNKHQIEALPTFPVKRNWS